jgi:hypothetical protein
MELLQKTTIHNLHQHNSTGKDNDSFVGIKIVGNDIHLYIPEAYQFDINSRTIRYDIISLLKTLSLADTKSKTKVEIFSKRENETTFALYSYLWIIDDFLKNGFFVNREKVFRTNQNGRVDWKKTFKTNPIISDGNIIYQDIIVSIRNNRDDLLSLIYRFCLKKSIDYIGWMFNMNSKFIQYIPFSEETKKKFVHEIDIELNSTFDDVKQLRLSHMKNIILGLDSSLEGKAFVYGVDKYHTIFEKMIDSIFGNIKTKSEFEPVGKWQLVRDGYIEKDSSKLRPDTIVIRKDTAYILDAKYYRFGTTGIYDDLPETTSIQKQITYGDFVKQNFANIKNVYNAFLLPFNKNAERFKSEDNLKYVGFAKSTWKDGKNNHEFVQAFLIDLKHVIQTWNKNNTDDIEFLIENIEKNSADIRTYLGFDS